MANTVTSHISRRANVISPMCLSVWVCGGYVVHHFNSIELCCAPSTVLFSMVNQGFGPNFLSDHVVCAAY